MIDRGYSGKRGTARFLFDQTPSRVNCDDRGHKTPIADGVAPTTARTENSADADQNARDHPYNGTHSRRFVSPPATPRCAGTRRVHVCRT